jgi:hypothetical protein
MRATPRPQTAMRYSYPWLWGSHPNRVTAGTRFAISSPRWNDREHRLDADPTRRIGTAIFVHTAAPPRKASGEENGSSGTTATVRTDRGNAVHMHTVTFRAVPAARQRHSRGNEKRARTQREDMLPAWWQSVRVHCTDGGDRELRIRGARCRPGEGAQRQRRTRSSRWRMCKSVRAGHRRGAVGDWRVHGCSRRSANRCAFDASAPPSHASGARVPTGQRHSVGRARREAFQEVTM